MVGVPDGYRGENVIAYVLLEVGADVVVQDLELLCRASLAACKRPRAFHLVDDLPRDGEREDYPAQVGRTGGRSLSAGHGTARRSEPSCGYCESQYSNATSRIVEIISARPSERLAWAPGSDPFRAGSRPA